MTNTLQTISIDKLHPHPKNPRLTLRKDVVDGITEQLKEGGYDPAHALIVRPVNGHFEIVSGHHRKAGAVNAGLKELPCWVRDMDDETAFMALVTSNNQGELSPLEIGIHALEAVGKTKGGKGKKGGVADYARKIGKSQQYMARLIQAAEVARSIPTPQGVGLEERTQHLCALHALPEKHWPTFVEAMLAQDWSVKDAEMAVELFEGYVKNPTPTKFPEFLPVDECAVAIGTGAREISDLSRLDYIAKNTAAALEKYPDIQSEWIDWLVKNRGAESWNIPAVQSKRVEFEGRASELESANNKPAEIVEYQVVVADPPWRYDFSQENRQIENQYPTASQEEICEAHKPQTAEDAVLFLWATAPKLKEAIEVMEAWGFQYKSHMIWDKEKIGMGYWFRGQHELLMVGTKGEFKCPEPDKRMSSVYREARAEHSAKPDRLYEEISKMFPNTKRLEMYSRKPRAGFDAWGNEAK